ncbi:nucleotide-diphospho-sugar transferase [Coprinopsis sp. MPI-PUGE-AT-0042]|nr:nucleotide-diphospho-sugar transferase [Coprinopsis sp. MPI-PUGE-AT-0042]
MDIDNVEPVFAKREFLAVLIAGFGNELLPLTSDHGDEPFPKALLPVANKPLLEYVLSWIEKSGINDVLLICPAIHRAALYHHLHSDVTSSSLRVDIESYEETQESPAGTCELLRHFAKRITEDFVLVPCDFLAPPALPLSDLLDTFRVESTSNDTLLTSCWYPAYVPDKSTLSDEWGPLPNPPPIIWDSKSGSLLHVDTSDDIDKNNEEIELSVGMVSRFSRTKLSSAYQDSHVYVCQKRVLTILQQRKQFDSFRQEFLPWLCRNQYRSVKLKTDKGEREATTATVVSQNLALGHSTTVAGGNSLTVPIELARDEDREIEKAGADSESGTIYKVSMLIHPGKPTLRINTLYNYLEINRHFLSQASWVMPSAPNDRSLIDQKAQISTDTIVGESTQISERTTIKRSVIGKHCKIGKFVKISGCIVLDHCIVEEGAKLEGCILGKNTKVGAKAELARCISCPGFEVNGGDVLKGEKLNTSDWTADPKVGSGDNSEESTEDDDSES